MSIASLNVLLEKTADWDKDERYMATNDLCTALTKDIKIDENMEQRICAAVLKQLDDQSNDVQSVAVKCLAIILKKVQQTQIGEICKKLCSLILDGKDALRDIYSIGLRTLIADVPDTMGALVVEKLTSNLLTGISRPGSEDVKRECLDNMSELLKRFGSLNDKDHVDIMNGIVAQLDHERMVIRKRAANCLGSLAVVSSDALLNRLVQTLLEKIDLTEKKSAKGFSSQETRTLIQTIGTISRTVGYRLGRHLDKIVPLFLRFCGDPDDETQQTDPANELRENCFPGLESFVLRCPREVAPFLPDIIKVSIAFMKYDPNYAYDDDEDASAMDLEEDGDSDEMQQDEDDEAFEADEDGGGGSDDDDTSWKVRKAAVKVISAVITARPELLQELYISCGDELIGRFKEREENVRLDIISCFGHLVQATCSVSALVNGSRSTNKGESIIAAPLLIRECTVGLLEARVNQIVAASCVQLSGASIKTKSAIFGLLRTVMTAMNGGLDRYINRLLNAADKCLLEKHQALKLDAMMFIRVALDHHPAEVLHPSLARLLPLVVSILGEDWYKIIAEALRVLGSIVQVMRPRDLRLGQFLPSTYDYRPLVPVIYSAILSRLSAQDIDQEIKECAILTVGKLLSHAGDELSEQLPIVLGLLQRRLENETTRSATLKTLIAVAGSPLPLDLSSFVTSSIEDLSHFLRQNSRTLQQLTLQCLDALLASPSAQITKTLVASILQESHVLISDTDLYLTHLSLRLTLTILKKSSKAAAESIVMFVYQRIVDVAKSALIQGVALQSLITLFQELAIADLAKMRFQDIFSSLYISTTTKGSASLSKQALSNLSKCVAGVMHGASAKVLDEALTRFTKDAVGGDESTRQLALLSLGEVGQTVDLSQRTQVQKLLLDCFESPAEDTKLAAAYALGHIAVGNMQVYLPVALQSTQSNKNQYLLLAALKEIIVVFANQNLDFQPYLSVVLPVLLEQCRSDEESVRNIVAECLGVLTAMNNEQILPVLLNISNDVEDKLSRRMVANALRFSLSRSSSSVGSAVLSTAMVHFLPLLEDSDLEVKRAALLMVNTAVHHNPHSIEAHLSGTVMPLLLETLKIKLERTVDLGPFKHKVDDNLPLRKVSLTCVETVLDAMPDRVDVPALMLIMPLLLTDKDEIKLQSHQILCKLASFSPTAVVGFVELLVEPLDKIVNKKINKDAMAAGPETERAFELIKSGLRVMLALNRLEDVGTISRKWNEFVERVKKSEQNSTFLVAIENEKSFDNL